MEPICFFLIGMFLIVVGGGVATVCNTIRVTSMWRSSMNATRDTIVGVSKNRRRW